MLTKSAVRLPGHFPAKQIIFHSHLLNDQGPRQVIDKLNKTNKLRLYTGRTSWKLEFFLSPDNDQTGNN